MIKEQKFGFKGMSKDIAKDKQSDKYFNAKNIRILATDQQSSFSVSNEHGNDLIFTIPVPVLNITETRIEYTVGDSLKTLPYNVTSSVFPRNQLEENYYGEAGPVQTSGTQIIIGTQDMRDSAIIVSTDDNGFDCFWELKNINSGDFELELKYMSNLELSKNNLIQILYNYENSIIEKIYFADGKNQLRFMNLRQSVDNGDSINLVDVNSAVIDSVSTIEMSSPEIQGVIDGGSHTSGMTQYAYSLYVLNGSQTTISPTSELVPIDKGDGLGGGEVNDNLGRSVLVNIPTVDNKFTHIKIYAIKYTSLNQVPELSLIADKEIDNFSNLQYFDDGSTIESISLAAFLFLGSSPIVPKHIASKDNRLFPINIKEVNFDINLDTRTYGHSQSGEAKVWENISVTTAGSLVGVETTLNTNTYSLPVKHDAINRNYDTYQFQKNGTTIGTEGKYVKVEIERSTLPYQESKNYRFLKDREIYRFSIAFYNNRGQVSVPKWLCDIKMPSGNLEDKYNKLKVTLKPEFYVWLNTASNFPTPGDKPVGYRIFRANRDLSDRTIVTQGMINPMIANKRWDKKETSLSARRDAANDISTSKMPSVTRMFETLSPFVGCKDYHELSWSSMTDSSFSQLGRGTDREVLKASSSKDWRAQSFQFNKLMQMFSPEAMFRDVQTNSSLKLRVVGLAEQNVSRNWTKETNKSNDSTNLDIKFNNGITTATPGWSAETYAGSANEAHDKSYFGPTNNDGRSMVSQMYRDFSGTFHPTVNNVSVDVYGSPESTEIGADFKTYNGDSSMRYSNHLLTFLQDDFNKSDDVNNDAEIQIIGASSNGPKCITFAEGSDDPTSDINLRKSIDEIYNLTGISERKGILVAEFVKHENEVYLGNIYGGNTYESKSINSYIGIGKYTKIDIDSVLIKSPGDTYVQFFNFTKLSKTDNENTSEQFSQVTEIVNYKVESSIDLKNRNDISIDDWDNRFQPKYEEFQQYNTVYSQQPTLVQETDPGFKFKKIQEYDTRIMSSKAKIPGENIDNWTDFLENEVQDLDGKHGPINAVINSNDEIYTFQDNGVAHISINPRVQTSGSDGVAVQLGTGGILHDYQYITTKSGCINKWGVVATQNGFYYIDLLNKAIVSYQGGIKGISDTEGFHQFFVNTLSYADLSKDNAVLNTGVSVGYNSVNNDVYFTFLQETNKMTICFNEGTGSFTSFYDYSPAWYINKGSKMITTNPNTTQVWEHFKGTRNSFYGVQYPSSITFNASPPGDRDCVFNNASYKMEMTSPLDEDLVNKTLTQVRLWNDYQDSGEVDLVLRKNIIRKFRHWKMSFPRNKGTRDRIRNPWTYVQFKLNNPDGNKMILHDMSIHYTEY